MSFIDLPLTVSSNLLKADPISAATNISGIFAGVGGQGVVLLSELLGNAAVKEGLKVRGSEVLGRLSAAVPSSAISGWALTWKLP